MYRKNLQCLYVGKTDTDLYMRINRWSRGVDGSLRPDENHAAATKARRDGIKLTDKLFIKYMLMEDVYRIVDDPSIRSEPLDEWIAPLLKSKYNKRTFNVGLEPFFK